MDNQSDMTSTVSKSLSSILEKVDQMRIALLLLSIAIALDIASLVMTQHNLLTVVVPPVGFASIAQWAVLLLMIFSLFMAVFAPTLQIAVNVFLWKIRSTRFGDRVFPESKYERPNYAAGEVRLSQLRRHAVDERCAFAMAIVRYEEARNSENEHNHKTIGRLSFGCLLLMSADYLLGGDASLVHHFVAQGAANGASISAVFTSLVSALVIFVMAALWWHDASADRCDPLVYYPKLAATLVERKTPAFIAERSRGNADESGSTDPTDP